MLYSTSITISIILQWWKAEPLWITAKKANLTVAGYLWSRCDLPFDGVIVEDCEKFEKIPGKEIFQTNIEKALTRFQDGYDLVMVSCLALIIRFSLYNMVR